MPLAVFKTGNQVLLSVSVSAFFFSIFFAFKKFFIGMFYLF